MHWQGHEGKSSSPLADTAHDRDSENSFPQGAKQLTKTRNLLKGMVFGASVHNHTIHCLVDHFDILIKYWRLAN